MTARVGDSARAVRGLDDAFDAAWSRTNAVAPSRGVQWLVRGVGMASALRLAPARVLPGQALSFVRGGPGWVRLRHVSEQPEPFEMCLARQAALLSLPGRVGLRAPVLAETSCLTRGDAACEYVVHCGGAPRWALVGAAALALAGVAAGAGQGAPVSAALGVGAGIVAWAVERSRSARANLATRSAASRAFHWLVARASVSAPGGRPAALDTHSSAPATRLPVLEREGDVWRVAFESATIRVRHSRGMALLSHLVRQPGQEIHVQTLDSFVPSAGSEGLTTIDPRALPPDGMSSSLGDAGPVLDARARADYRRRVAELRADLDDAERCNDLGRAAAARAELDLLEEELAGATGLGGRVRRASPDVERMRVAVTRRIRAAIEQVGKQHPTLGEHLRRSVRTGITCCYTPAAPDATR